MGGDAESGLKDDALLTELAGGGGSFADGATDPRARSRDKTPARAAESERGTRKARPVDTGGLESIFSRVGDQVLLSPAAGETKPARGGDIADRGHAKAAPSGRPERRDTSPPPDSHGDGYEARRVFRVVRGVSVWSLFRVSLLFYICVWMVVTVAGVILWTAARAIGITDNIEKFVAELLADESFTIDGFQLLKASLSGGLVLVLSGAAFTALLGVLFNMIGQVTGGIRVSVVELETARPAKARRGGTHTRRGRRPTVR